MSKCKELDKMNEIIDFFLSKKVKVWINHNNETGEWQYSVQVAEGSESDREFWLTSFSTEREALDYIASKKLPLVTAPVVTRKFNLNGIWVDRYKYKLLDLCHCISMFIRGSSDEDPSNIRLYCEFLQARINDWQPTAIACPYHDYDDKVKRLVQYVCECYIEYRITRGPGV